MATNTNQVDLFSISCANLKKLIFVFDFYLSFQYIFNQNIECWTFHLGWASNQIMFSNMTTKFECFFDILKFMIQWDLK